MFIIMIVAIILNLSSFVYLFLISWSLAFLMQDHYLTFNLKKFQISSKTAVLPNLAEESYFV